MIEDEICGDQRIHRCAIHAEVYAPDDVEGKVYAEVASFVQGNEVIHMSNILNAADEMEPSFLLIEPLGAHHETKLKDDGQLKLAKDALQILLSAGYFFDEHTNQQIFDQVSNFLPVGTISPYYVEQALLQLSTNYPTAKLQKVVIDDYGTGYVENEPLKVEL